LEHQVCISANAHSSPIRYLSAVERGYRRRTGADCGYAGTIIRSPFKHDYIDTGRLYSLAELDSWLDFEDKAPEYKGCEAGIGRNVTLFDNARRWAYRNVREYSSLLSWHNAVLSKCNACNVFVVPLMQSEVRATAKSIATWTWERRGKLGGKRVYGCSRQEVGKVTARLKSAGTEAKIAIATATLRAQGKKPTPTAIARLAGIDRATVYRHRK